MLPPLLATWFGAGTLLTQADEVEAAGLQRAALDPFGAGLCLLLAGVFFAGPLWRMNRLARQVCLLAGGAYLLMGLLPLMFGVGGRLIPEVDPAASVVLSLARKLLTSLVVLIVFLLALVSAVLSTIDSAFLSPAFVLGWNLFSKMGRLREVPELTLVKLAVVLVTLGSVLLAYVGESAYELLEGAFELPLGSLFVPVALGLLLKPRGQVPAVLAMIVGTGL